MDDSFTLQLEPINSIRSEKQYIQEIENLRSENFGLKTENARLKHNPFSNNEYEKTLVETKTVIENLQQQKNILVARVNELEAILRNTETHNFDEKDLSIKMRNENIDLKEENSRLMKHIENLNKKLEQLEQENTNAKTQFMKREMEITREFETFEAKSKELRLLKDEVYMLRDDNKKYMQRVKEFHNVTLTLETQNQKMYNLEKMLADKTAEISKLKNEFDNEKENWEKNIKERNKIIDSNKHLYIEKMNERLNEIIELKKQVAASLKPENINISQGLQKELEALNIPTEPNKINASSVISKLIKIIYRNKNKIENLENESKMMNNLKQDRARFLNKETLELLDAFGKEFSGARSELNECQVYLEKKGSEIKELKREIFRLKRIA
ncbi:hypothetical protein CDIK_3193 [Cucumispora dikerogammari]|nr:hypothetical protein CDIK_3193 [Cucumispora dikerogammari]